MSRPVSTDERRGSLAGALRSRPARSRPARRPIPPSEQATLNFLADVLTGETHWSMGEVQQLLALHTLVGLGRWHAVGLDDDAGAPA